MLGPRMLLIITIPSIVIGVFVWSRYARGNFIEVRAWWLLVIATIVNFLFFESLYPGAWREAIVLRGVVLCSTVCFCWFAIANWRGRSSAARLGLSLGIVGAVTNAIPQIIYGAMPYSLTSARLAGFSDSEMVAGGKHLPASDIHPLILTISDVLPVPGVMKVFSIGDLLLLVAVVLFFFAAGRRRTLNQIEMTSVGKEVKT